MENAKAFPFVTLAARVVVSTVACHTGGRERAGKSLDGGWDPSLVNGPRSAEKKFMDLLKQVEKVYGPPMHFTHLFSIYAKKIAQAVCFLQFRQRFLCQFFRISHGHNPQQVFPHHL